MLTSRTITRAVLVALCTTASQSAIAQFTSPSFTSDKAIAPAGLWTPTGVAFDGTNYWIVSGAGINAPMAKFDAAGNQLATYTPGPDFRSVFTNASGHVFASGFNSSIVYAMTGDGIFSPLVTLTGIPVSGYGGLPEYQSPIILSAAGDEYLSMARGIVYRWSLDGSFIGTRTLVGFGAADGLGNSSYDVRIANLGSNWVTYNAGTRTLSLWNPSSGARMGTTLFSDAISSSYDFSVSTTADGRVWVGQGDRLEYGYSVSQIAAELTAAPEPSSAILLASGLAGVFGAVRRKRKARLAA